MLVVWEKKMEQVTFLGEHQGQAVPSDTSSRRYAFPPQFPIN